MRTVPIDKVNFMELKIVDLEIIDFLEAWNLQKKTFEEVKSGKYGSALIICQHNPVITLGRQARQENILVDEGILKVKGIQLHTIERGGGVTYHGPGQITIYPIFNLNYFKKDIHWFLRSLEEVAIDFLSDFRITGIRKPDLTGVWVAGKKIASIGIAIRNWITFHGLTINIKEADLANFKLIRPCGMDVEMTSVETVSGRKFLDGDMFSIKKGLVSKFKEVLAW